MRLLGFLVFAYLAGSLNFAVCVMGILGKGDPREAFSGNAGTTNVYRLAGRGWAAFVLCLDAGRGAGLAVLALALLPPDLVSWVGLALVLGNRFPLFHGFRGGKGVASYLGFCMPVAPWGTALACLLWVIVHRLVRLPFVASVCMILTLGGAVVAATGFQGASAAGTVVAVLFILCNHKGNLIALRAARKWGDSSPISSGENRGK